MLDSNLTGLVLLKRAAELAAWPEDLTLLLLRQPHRLGHPEVYVEEASDRERTVHEENAEGLHRAAQKRRSDEILQEYHYILSDHDESQCDICANLRGVKRSQGTEGQLEEESDDADEDQRYDRSIPERSGGKHNQTDGDTTLAKQDDGTSAQLRDSVNRADGSEQIAALNQEHSLSSIDLASGREILIQKLL